MHYALSFPSRSLIVVSWVSFYLTGVTLLVLRRTWCTRWWLGRRCGLHPIGGVLVPEDTSRFEGSNNEGKQLQCYICMREMMNLNRDGQCHGRINQISSVRYCNVRC